MSWIARKWRSVSFRAGLVSAVLVGFIALIGALLVVGVVFGSVSLAVISLQLQSTERGLDQLRLGADPAEIDLGIIETAGENRSFWVLLEDGQVVKSQGEVVDELFDLPFNVESAFLTIESEFAPDLLDGNKRFEGDDWFYLEGEVTTDGTTYTLISATVNGFTYWGFVRDGLPILVAVVLLTALGTGFITGLFSRLALRSVEKMRIEVEQISHESLDRRVPPTGAGDGIDKLALTMNDMLGRLETQSAQQGAFLAAASHELRSPVAGLLAQLDVAVMYPDRADTAALLPKLQAEAQRLQLLVDDLLYLSRSEAQLTDRPAPSGQRVDLDELLKREAEHLRLMHPGVAVSIVGERGQSLAGLERDLSRAVRNLAENAARHATSSVEFGVKVLGQMASVTVKDDGAGVSPVDAERIFDRFVRLDEARGRDEGGSGLGLAIVHEIARRHGGGVSLIDQDLPGATFQLLVPVSP